MASVPTEIALRDWRFGQTQAERLCAAVLNLESFEHIDPQCPLGGPDGTKDIICFKDGKKWIAGAYFPTTYPSFTEIKKKLSGDLQGVKKNEASGFAFLINQPLTPTERAELIDIANRSAELCEIYHLERLRLLLDAPKGYGIRLEYLRIPMNEEEQFAFWSTFNYDLTRKLLDNERQLSDINTKLDLVIARTTAIHVDLLTQPSSITSVSEESVAAIEMPISNLSIADLCWIHRIITEDVGLTESVRGRLRSVNVWIGSKDNPRFVPPPPETIPQMLRELLIWWQESYPLLVNSQKEKIVLGIGEFHHRFLSIHPFLDANGRLSRILLDQAAHELLNMRISKEFVAEPNIYYDALSAADRGDLTLLSRLIIASLQ
jgi:fido (protein-threonine AMPylation protein)